MQQALTEWTLANGPRHLVYRIVGEHKVICPLHAFVFDLSSGQPVGNNCGAIKTYPVTVTEEGQIFVDTGAI